MQHPLQCLSDQVQQRRRMLTAYPSDLTRNSGDTGAELRRCAAAP